MSASPPSVLAQAEAVWTVGAELGEGPVWVAEDRAVYFVDIKAPRIHRLEPETGAQASWPAPAPVGFIVPVRSGGFVCGLQGGLHRFDPADGGFERLCSVEPDRPGNRVNDGFVDPAGRLWFGTMDDAEREAVGALYCWDSRGRPAQRDAGYGVTNGPAVSPDGRTLYHADSPKQTIYAFDLAADGGLSSKRMFVRTKDGYPDGMAVDAEGCLWTALFAGGRIERYSPDGRLIGQVPFPCANVTKLAFGSDDLRTVYATTARLHLSPQERERQPQAGHLFRFRVETPGLPQALFNM
jgi:sugar lactone lactonase YvrE